MQCALGMQLPVTRLSQTFRDEADQEHPLLEDADHPISLASARQLRQRIEAVATVEAEEALRTVRAEVRSL